MVVSFGDALLVVIGFFGILGAIRGVRAAALTTGAICFAFVVVVLAGSLVMDGFRKLGFNLSSADTQAAFEAALFVFTAFMANRVIASIVGLPRSGFARSERIWGFVLGLLNGFFVMAMIQHYLSAVLSAAAGRANVSVGVPALSFSHPTADSWSVKLVPSTFTFLPPTPSADLWAKLPVALVLLLLFLGFVFAGTLYNRLSGSRG
jgi:uncharacterized membrane protein required for colicin V production